MTVRDVILQALAGKPTWIQAADILGRSACSIRRLRLKPTTVLDTIDRSGPKGGT